MRNELQQLEMISNYVTKRMQADERLAFEGQIALDPELRTEVESVKMIIRAVQRRAWSAEIRQAEHPLLSKEVNTKGNAHWHCYCDRCRTIVVYHMQTEQQSWSAYITSNAECRSGNTGNSECEN